MCGICGYTKINDASQDGELIKKLTNLIKHRGPDAEGYMVDEKVALGHRRLSIIDLNTGAQPLRIENGNYTIIFNGEIYNYLELKEKLKSNGYNFKTTSDTEVLLNMYVEYGEDCVKHLNGMFTFCVYDKKRGKLFLARDRLGIKPLFYAKIGEDLVFASEVKAIINYPGFKRELNTKVLNSYFQYRYVLGEETFFKNVLNLAPGSYLQHDLKNGSTKIKKYWDLDPAVNKKDKGEAFYYEKVKNLVTKAVERRMISDVPIGAYLSGGLDSSIIAGLMTKLSKGKVKTFTIGFEERGFNEFEYARLAAEKMGTDHHEILLRPKEYFRTMEKLISYKDAPLAVPNEVPLYIMSKELKKHITVVLSGEGADELFGGYGRIFISYLNYIGSGKKHLEFFLNEYNYVSDSDLQKFLSTPVRQEIKQGAYTYNIFKARFNKTLGLDIRDVVPYIFQTLHLQGLLQRLDMTTMAASVEGRVPFVDHELIEFVNTIPFQYKIAWNKYGEKEAIKKKLNAKEISETYDTTKYILKKAFKELLPAEIVERRKVGFPVPLQTWFRNDFSEYARSILEDKRTLKRGVYNDKYIRSGKYLEELSGINVWMMINLELFIRQHFD